MGERRGTLLLGRSVPIVVIVIVVVTSASLASWPIVFFLFVVFIPTASFAAWPVVFIIIVGIITTAFAAGAILFLVFLDIASAFATWAFLFIIVNIVIRLVSGLRHLGLEIVEEASLLLGVFFSGCCLLFEETPLLPGLLIFGRAFEFLPLPGRRWWWRRRRRRHGLWPRCGFRSNRTRRGRA
ncbi:MAG: hypothetical protein U0792_18785 [Gemmataceae bacterium]